MSPERLSKLCSRHKRASLDYKKSTIYTSPEVGIFENGCFTLKPHQMCFVRTTLEEFKIATISGDFGFVFEELWKKTWARQLHYYRSFFWFSKCFPSTRKRKAGVFKFLRCQERFRKVSFSWRISLNSRPNCRSKAGCIFKFLRSSEDLGRIGFG